MNELDGEHKDPAYRVHRNKWAASGLCVTYSKYGPTFVFHHNWPLKSKFLSSNKVDYLLMFVKNELL